jgi:hypothetical protein
MMKQVMRLLGRKDQAAPAPAAAPLAPPARKPVRRFAVTDAEGRPTAFYSDDIHRDAIPADAVPISEEQHRKILSHGGVMRHRIVGGELVEHAHVASLADLARAAATAGLIVTWSGRTAEPVKFATDHQAMGHLTATAAVIATTGKLPGGAKTYPARSVDGRWNLLDVDEYRAVAVAAASYVSALGLIADGNPLGATDLPADKVRIKL